MDILNAYQKQLICEGLWLLVDARHAKKDIIRIEELLLLFGDNDMRLAERRFKPKVVHPLLKPGVPF